ncbi:hypothetical protein RND81_13G219800 [Saponaria officinalis]|uniref:Lethal giant larvae (Lgl)-like C-terminal domain-containing protein n=1 Tax=Saponaria officinalis TaxID=3572 RepID=A0AAW1H0U7_SAPOF
MFVKKLVGIATKKPASYSESLKPEDVAPRLTFHYGLPAAATMLAYDPLHRILALSTKHGQIKLLGKHNTQALLESDEEHPSKFLQFIPSYGVLFNVTFGDKIEVWNIETKILSHVHQSSEEITSFAVLQQCLLIFIGDSTGNVTVWKLDQESLHIEKMKYYIPYSASHGITNKDAAASSVRYILPQPTAETKRIFLIFADGSMVLWAIEDSKVMSMSGGSTVQLFSHESKKVTSASWVCPFGSKIAVGYSTGDILFYSIFPNSKAGSASVKGGNLCNAQIAHASKLNLGYKLEKIPIASLKCVYSDGKANRLYVIGTSDATLVNLVQVILLSEDTESQTIKLGLQLPEPCVDIEIISSANELSKNKQEFLILLGKSGRMYAYDDHSIEKYLIQSQKKSPLEAPSEMMIKLPNCASSVTSAQIYTNHKIKDYTVVAKNLPSLLPFEAKHFSPSHFTGFSNIKNLYITGHSDGTINFWDATCSLLIPLLSLTQQSEDDSFSSGIAVTAIYYCAESRILFSGDSSGIVRTYQFKPEPFAIENNLFSLAGIRKKGSNHVIQTVKHVKVNGPILHLNKSSGSRHLAVGCEHGLISLIDVEGPSVLYHKQIETVLSEDIMSLEFDCVDFHGLQKNILVVATRDSSVLALDADTGNTLSSSVVHPKKSSRALLMKILDTNKGILAEDSAQKPQLLLLCSEKAAYIYSLSHAVHGEKKVCYKKKFHSSSCYWASLFGISSSLGVMLLFACGKIEIRSLPELSLVKEATLRSVMHMPVQENYLADYFLCSSPDGEVIMMRSDQEILVASMLLNNESQRHLDSFSQVYDKDLIASKDRPAALVHQKEKKKGIFGSVFQDITGSRTNHGDGDGDMSASSEEVSVIFSTSNFPIPAEDVDNKALEVDSVDLDIDDIDLNEHDGKPKGNNVTALLDKQKLASKFHSFKGKLKQMTVKNEKPSAQEDPPSGKAEAVDQIKRKYGYSSSDSSLAEVVQSKLADNVKRLQGITVKTADMEDNASSFSSMAKETLRLAEHKSQK